MNHFNLLRNSLNYKDKMEILYNKIIEKKSNLNEYNIEYEIINKNNDLDIPIANFYSDVKDLKFKKNILFSAKIQAIGVYYSDDLKFQWSWSIPTFPKNWTYLSRKILRYGIDLDIKENVKSDKNYNIVNLYIKSILSNSMILLDNESFNVNIDLLESLILYITKSMRIMKRKKKNFTEYLVLYDLINT